MEERIQTHFDAKISGYVVTLPGYVTLHMIEEWKVRFKQKLKEIPSSNNCSLLFNTGPHNFENIQCLKSLRQYLSEDAFIKSCLTRAALIAPAKFMIPIVKSDSEAYFDNIDSAYQWLMNNKEKMVDEPLENRGYGIIEEDVASQAKK